ncbi:MAG TPA: V-type ATP synthase subunit F [Kofleriaceae bacterium]|nr:V-type ATP synthase subunit F [Kofleriaceae bacterium]
MTGQVVALARAGLAQGLALAGVPVVEATSLAAGVDELAARAAEPGPRVLLVDAGILAAAPPALLRRIAAQPVPVVLAVPGPAGEPGRPAGEEEILALLRQAIGYRVRLR